MKPIRMLRTMDGSPDGVSVHSYAKGHEYPAAGFPLSEDLLGVFLREGWAEEIGSPGPVVTSAQEPAASEPAEAPKPEHSVGGAARIIQHPAPPVIVPDAQPCSVTSAVGEACTLKAGHDAPELGADRRAHEWAPVKPAVKTRRGRRGG